MKKEIIKIKNLVRSFKNGDTMLNVLKNIDLVICEGEFVAIMGRSGAGKSTLMYQMSLLDEPTKGDIIINGIDTHTMSQDEKTEFRLANLGYVFQDYALLPELNAQENIAIPLLMRGISEKEAFVIANDSLILVGLNSHSKKLTSQLSGGEQQRVSIARAIAHNPNILFADEPTANLDNESSRLIMDIFDELHKNGQTIIMVTHEEEFGKRAERIIHLDDGKIKD